MSEKKKENTYSEFMSAAMEFLAARPNSNVLIVVESDIGFDMFRSVGSPVWSLGAASAAVLQIERLIKDLAMKNVDAAERIEGEEEERIRNSVKRDKEKAN